VGQQQLKALAFLEQWGVADGREITSQLTLSLLQKASLAGELAKQRGQMLRLWEFAVDLHISKLTFGS
jgi:hypothetical protein